MKEIAGNNIASREELLGLDREELKNRLPAWVYVEGLSDGESTTVDDMYEEAYFESFEAWISFLDTIDRSLREPYDSPNRTVPADFLRWVGADSYLVGMDVSFLYKREIL